jgi:hypothetical protein
MIFLAPVVAVSHFGAGTGETCFKNPGFGWRSGEKACSSQAIKTGQFRVEGESGGFAAVDRATTDLPSAVDGADVIIVVTGGSAQAVVARSLAPLLRDGQVILLIQGNTGGSLIVRRTLDDAGCRADVDVAEMDNYPYSCWRLSPTRIRPIVRKRWLQIATFPGNRIGAVFPRLSPLFPEAAVAAALGASVPIPAEWFDRVYAVRGATLLETCQRLTYNSD